MKIRFRILLGGVACVLLLHVDSPAADDPAQTATNWPQWRGPLGSGVAPHATPPVKWSEDQNIQWKVKIPGSGHSTPVIWGNQVFVLTSKTTGEKAATPENARSDRPANRPERGAGRAQGELGNRGERGPEDRTERGDTRSPRQERPDSERDRSQNRRPEGRRPSSGGGFNREEILKRYDKDSNGELSDKEREAMREDFRSRFRGRGGERGGRSGRSGRGGFGSRSAPTEEHQFMVLSYDRKTGKELWRRVATKSVPHESHHRDHGYASASPVTDGEHMLAYFGSRGLFCFDMQGNPKWQKDFGDMKKRNSFGEGSSPALHGDTIVVLWDHEGDSFIYAMEKSTGKLKWKFARDERSGWATPLILEHEGVAQVVVNASNAVRSYNLDTGRLLWECGGQTSNTIPSVVSGHGMVYATSGFRGSYLAAIQLGHTGDLSNSKAIAWSHNRGTPYVPSPLLSGERIYYLSGNNGILSCRDAKSGESLFESERLEGIRGIYASPVAASGRVYIAGREGKVAVLKDSGNLEVLAINELEDGFDTSPAAVGNQLFLRGRENLYCIATN